MEILFSQRQPMQRLSALRYWSNATIYLQNLAIEGFECLLYIPYFNNLIFFALFLLGETLFLFVLTYLGIFERQKILFKWESRRRLKSRKSFDKFGTVYLCFFSSDKDEILISSTYQIVAFRYIITFNTFNTYAVSTWCNCT